MPLLTNRVPSGGKDQLRYLTLMGGENREGGAGEGIPYLIKPSIPPRSQPTVDGVIGNNAVKPFMPIKLLSETLVSAE